MFTVGYELDLSAVRGHGRAVPLVAVSAFAVPMCLAVTFALLYRSGFAALGAPRDSRSFVLFMGVAMSITAMPVLAAIVRERGLAGLRRARSRQPRREPWTCWPGWCSRWR
jgi:Kef-type K+ transport system membrane component KefB